MTRSPIPPDTGRSLSRRDFLASSGKATIGLAVLAANIRCRGGEAPAADGGTGDGGRPDNAGIDGAPDAASVIPASGGYLLVDTRKCQGCTSCMIACSLVNEGTTSFSLARIQVMQSSFAQWPNDITIETCRQCLDPKCLAACQFHAVHVDRESGDVRAINADNCVGCGACALACPHTPSRPMLYPDPDYDGARKSRKCDLCAHAPYHWDPAGGGPGGSQACVEVCPVRAIAFTATTPVQEGDAGYKVNLRDETWGALGFPTD